MKARHLVYSLLAICGLSLPASAASNPLTFADIFAVNTYKQDTSAAPTNPSSAFFTFGASMIETSDYNAASATYPPAGTRTLSLSGTTFSSLSQPFSSLTALHNSFPFGTYTITATNTITSATQTETLNYADDHFTTSIPAFTPTTFDAIHAYNAALPLTLSFNTFIKGAGTTTAFTIVWIDDKVTGTRAFASSFLGPTTSNLSIPPNTLLPGRNYDVTLIFTSRLDVLASNPKTTVFEGFDVRSISNFTTLAVPEPASLSLAAVATLALLKRRR